jgi:hypothetical protein
VIITDVNFEGNPQNVQNVYCVDGARNLSDVELR